MNKKLYYVKQVSLMIALILMIALPVTENDMHAHHLVRIIGALLFAVCFFTGFGIWAWFEFKAIKVTANR